MTVNFYPRPCEDETGTVVLEEYGVGIVAPVGQVVGELCVSEYMHMYGK